MSKLVSIERIRTDGGTQPRSDLRDSVVADYAEALEAGAELPAVTVFDDGEVLWLADGFHRLAAHVQLARETIAADVRPGTQRDAILHAAGANAEHGLRRTRADKRRAVESLLRDPEWAAWSDREIARRCKVSHPLVAKVREELASGNVSRLAERKVTRAGVTFLMDTSAIGWSKARWHKNLDSHPWAEFLQPMMPTDWLIVERISERLREGGRIFQPITLYEGMILDGRIRHRAAVAAGVECPAETYEDLIARGFRGTPLDVWWSANMVRMGVSAERRALTLVRLLSLMKQTGAPCRSVG